MSTEHQIDKPILFISHTKREGEFANVVKQEIEKVFADGLEVFCTSSPGSIPAGQDLAARHRIEAQAGKRDHSHRDPRLDREALPWLSARARRRGMLEFGVRVVQREPSSVEQPSDASE